MNKRKRILETASETGVKMLAGVSVVIIAFVFIFIFIQAWPVISASGIKLFTTNTFDTQISEAFYDAKDFDTLDFGLLGLILGTLVTTGLALIIASVIGVGSAVFISEMAPAPVAATLKAIVRLLASIPSVVFGLLGVIAVVPYIEEHFISTELQLAYLDYYQITGLCLLAAVIVLTFMIVPTVIAMSVDAIDTVPNHLKEVGYAFGMSHFRVIWKIILPSSRSGIIASITLAAGRGIGEAIAVSMVCGGLGIIPDFVKGFVAFIAPVLPLASAIVNKSEAMSSLSVKSALFACAAILLLFGTAMSIAASLVEKRMLKATGNEV